MFHNYSSLYGLQVHGTDRNIGTLWDILFDDHTGKINYFVINISTWFFGKHVLVIPEKCSIDDGICMVAMSSGEIRNSPDESIDPPVYMQEQDNVYSAVLVSPGLINQAGGFPLFTGELTATPAGDKAGKTARLRSVREVVSYSVNEPDCEQLRNKAPDAYIVVEKILAHGEDLPERWPMQGTTGYDFLNAVHHRRTWKPVVPSNRSRSWRRTSGSCNHKPAALDSEPAPQYYLLG